MNNLLSNLAQEIEKLTLELVNIPSINGSEGERNVSNKIYEYIKNIEYFKKHGQYCFQVPLIKDPYGRMNVFALLRGEKKPSCKTIILHGHMDTVGVDDFGSLSELAFYPDKLEEKLKELDLPEEVKKDLNSGDWIFGRGAADMKSGVAVHLAVLKELSENVENFSGNILFMSNPVEENQHTGVIESLDILNDLKRKYGLDYKLAINNDYICPLYPGDNKKYVYTGAVGKILPSFYIAGQETHVGQCFEGLNPNQIASELIKDINLNTGLCDGYKGEYTLPPSVLKYEDLKKNYNVQTPFAAFTYFNYFIHDASINEIIEKLKIISKESFDKVILNVNDNYKKFCKIANQKYEPLPWKTNVMTYSELYKKVKSKYGHKLDDEINGLSKTLLDQGMDIREVCLNVVDKLWKMNREKKPAIVLFFAPPYCPHNTLKDENEFENSIIEKIKKCVNTVGKENNEDFEVLQFFPSLSDSSYLKIDDDLNSIENLKNNLPNWAEIYNIPVNEMKKLNIPAINYGCYGKDAHKWTERVYKPYSFNTLPKLISSTVYEFLK
ncbi:MAG: M20/M25/M40 family metallo-hydrolase [Clostridium tyrobutyricum]|uniref:M20/M25/M40 family metallo-hydrolase n=1 Tax=Clostridium tyrobutyricum TaxID=1519 RepID=UPI0011C82341|nr:M20/M25/M40 family metallo-hydrolase [Clostridium tyrobutyricum]MCH4199836.1 M20/M25/M40 family metallo-hydrolase [Clostridium tyrobutyricum]MCH4238050.1 M20/M25/M40 family metallo-hydrolase [Clostridium tyrobutyricum]MCH4258353.1 M20/M25/M40 family metallo-hydrolase [Clostridium tyrobutyricum]MCI1239522.1 M20/M25/M40 family metallo-hydrolase [Clostridium tyrobutyricum]MCI1653235.1 M20/M25/M40 family metallo-hydrolase [Clostridium tyrobutyricum]